MTSKKKIAVVIISRANYARAKSVLQAIKDHPKLELILIVGASALLDKYGNVVEVIERDGFRVHARVFMTVEGGNLTTMSKSTGMGLLELSTILDHHRPDVVLTIGDKYETLATAVAATYMNMTLAHTMGGEISGTIDESIRHAITRLAHIHLVTTKGCHRRLLKWGEEPERIFQVGCPAMDLLLDRTPLDNSFWQRNKGVGREFDVNEPFLVVLQHPVTSEFENSGKYIRETIKAIDRLKMNTLWLWPNNDAGSEKMSREIRIYRELQDPQHIYFIKNTSPEDFIRLLDHTACLVGNSSSGIREGSFLGTPFVAVGSRQHNREQGKNVINVEYNAQAITKGIVTQLQHGKYQPSRLYGDGDAGKKIAAILARVKVPIQKKLTY